MVNKDVITYNEKCVRAYIKYQKLRSMVHAGVCARVVTN